MRYTLGQAQSGTISKINLVTRACNEYERIRYGNDNQLGFDAAVNVVLKNLGLEK